MTPSSTVALMEQLREEEGVRLKPYVDCCGRGWRERCTSKSGVHAGKLTIGIGRNLDDVGITAAEANFLLVGDVTKVVTVLDARAPWWKSIDDIRQRVLADMAFNLGTAGLLDGWPQTMGLVKTGMFVGAAAAMRASKWAGQVGRRAKRLALMMETGKEVAL